jgi:hypothetical protein
MKKLLLLLMSLSIAIPLYAEPSKHFWRDWRWWTGELFIGAAQLSHGIGCNMQRTGGSKLFGNNTTSGRIAGVELIGFSIGTGLEIIDWKTAHSCASWSTPSHPACEDPNKFWRAISYWSVPAIDDAVTTPFTLKYYYPAPPAKPDLSKVEIIKR